MISYYWEKLTFSKLQLSNFKKVVTRSVFVELQLTQISLNVQTSCCNLKIGGLRFKVKDSMHFVEQKYKFYQKRDGIENGKFYADIAKDLIIRKFI